MVEKKYLLFKSDTKIEATKEKLFDLFGEWKYKKRLFNDKGFKEEKLKAIQGYFDRQLFGKYVFVEEISGVTYIQLTMIELDGTQVFDKLDLIKFKNNFELVEGE